MMTHYSLRSTWSWLLLLALAACLSAMVRSQALPTAKGPGSHIDVGAGLSVFQQDYGQRYIGGTTYFVDAYPHWRYGLEAEARLLNQHTSQQVTLSSYLIGAKVGIRPHPSTLQPYGKMMVGIGRIVLPFRYAQGNFLAYAPGAGLDIALGDYVKVRAVDFEYQRWPDFPYGALRPYGLTTGVSIRLTHLHRYPEGSSASYHIPR